ncbi:MAG: O-antigen ligase family protein [Pseudomonadota bacterium]|nr:O-antigen ligase family protein [Pseudomonadota bacterium]
MLGFLLFVTSAALFFLEWLAAPRAAIGRLRTGAARPIFGYAIFSLLSIGLMLEQTDHQLDALRELKWVLYFFALMYFFHRYFTEAWKRYIPALSVAVMLMGVFTLCQFLYGWEWPRAESVLAPWSAYFRVTGFFNQPQSIAGNLGMAVFFLLGISLAGFSAHPQSAKGVSPFLLASVALGSLGVLLTLTRAAWVGLAVTLIIALARVKKKWGVIPPLGMALLVAMSLNSGSIFGDRLSGDVVVNTKSIEVRLELWAANWQMFLSQPYLGVGPDQNLFQLEGVYAQADFEHGVIDRAHNNVLEHLAALGIFVAGFYLVVSGYFLWAAYCLSSRLNPDTFTRAIGTGSLLAQIYFHILGLVDSNFFDQEVKNSIVWFWALTAATYIRDRNDGAAESTDKV